MKNSLKGMAVIAAAVVFFGAIAAYANVVSFRISEIHIMEEKILNRLYMIRPDTVGDIKNAAGYAVFSSSELGVLWPQAGFGHGVAHNNADGVDTYMEMTGIKPGAFPLNTVFIFHEAAAFQKFIATGLDFSDTTGYAARILAGTRIYQLADSGLLPQPLLQGTRFWRDNTMPQTPMPGQVLGSAGENVGAITARQ